MKLIYFIKKIRWSVRKLTLAISKSDLVLEVGSGGNPHPYSSVLVERYVSNEHRLKAIEIDERLVIADAQELPFRDNTFDFSLAFHVLEHVSTPEKFLSELNRTSKSGYIETPNVLYERLTPFDVHLLDVSSVDDQLLIYKKQSAYPDPIISNSKFLENSKQWSNLFSKSPEMFHVQYHWKGEIKWLVLNPDVDLGWFKDPEETELELETSSNATVSKYSIRKVFVKWLKARKGKKVTLSELFVCPKCKGDLDSNVECYICSECSIKYKKNPVPDFINYEKYR